MSSERTVSAMWMKVIAATSMLVVGLAAPAQAQGQQRTVVANFSAPYEFVVDCSAFGAHDFENLVSGIARLRVTEVVDRADGELLQTVIDTTYRETDTNATTGRSLRVHGGYRQVGDEVAGTLTLTGNVLVGHAAGEGIAVQETGRLILDTETRQAQFLAGPHDAYTMGGADPAICAALAG
jgi:hypothetical protein